MDFAISAPAQLSAHLRALRKSRWLSQAQLGAALGVGQTRITRIERDPTAIGVEQLLALLGVLGVQMVLRQTAPAAAAVEPAVPSKPAAARDAAAKRHPPDEPR